MKESDQRRDLSADLIGYHLGLCDADERRRIEAAAGKNMASAQERVERAMAALELDEIPPVPANLTASILARVQQSRTTIPFPKQNATLPAPMEVGGRGSNFNLRELVGLAAAIMLFVGIFVPGYRTARNAAQQAMCANNMRMIGNGVASYADMFGSPVPYVRGAPAGANWLPNGGSTAQRFRNSPNSWVLVSNQLVPGKVFVCPGRPNDVPFTSSPDGLNDFPDARNNSYSTMAVTEKWQQRNFDPQMPLVADMSPLVDDAQDLRANRPVPENSASHGAGRGQNVLRGNISVIWANSPRVGIDNDDIYRLIGVQKYTGQEWPRLRSDAFLIP